MKDKYRLLFFKQLYDSLELSKCEDFLSQRNIGTVEGEQNMCDEELTCRKISRYFYLLNDPNIEALSEEERRTLERIGADSESSEIEAFFNSTYEKVLFSDSESPKVYYGPKMCVDYEADKDDIAIGLKYDVFGLAAGHKKTAEQIEREELLVNNMLRQIESNPNFKIKVIIYDELYELEMRSNPNSYGPPRY